jgi:hypothetical protein
MFVHVVTRSVRVLRICVAVLRDVTVLAAGPPSLSYEPTGPALKGFRMSQTSRSAVIDRLVQYT